MCKIYLQDYINEENYSLYVRLEKTVIEMVTGCLRMIKSIIFACR